MLSETRCSVKRVLATLVLGVSISACGGSSATSPSPTVTAVTVSGSFVSAIGERRQLTATASLSNGTKQDVPASATWTLGAGATGITVSSAGMVTAQGFGSGDVVATYQGRSGVFSVVVGSRLLSGGKQFFNATIAPSGVNVFLVSLGVGEVMDATLVNQGPQTSVTFANAEWRFSDYPTCSVLHPTAGISDDSPVSTYGIGVRGPGIGVGGNVALFGSSPTQICVAIFDTRLLTDTTTPNDWNPPIAFVNYIITFEFSGSGTASPQ